MWLAEGLQVAGALLILAAYLMAQLRDHVRNSASYLCLNLIGAGILAWLAGAGHLWGFLLLESVWSAVAGYALASKALRRRAPGRPPVSEGGDVPP